MIRQKPLTLRIPMKKHIVIMIVSSIVFSLFGCGEMAKPRKRADSGESMSQSVRDAVRDADGSLLDRLDVTYTDVKNQVSFKYSGNWSINELDASVSGPHRKVLQIQLPADEPGKISGMMLFAVGDFDPKLMQMTREGTEKALKRADAGFSILEFEKIKFDGEDCVYSKAATEKEGFRTLQTSYYFNSNNRAFHLSFFTYQGNDLAPYFDAVLKSFKK